MGELVATWEWFDEAEALFHAFNEKLPRERQMSDELIGVGEASLALGGVAYSYEDLAMAPDADLMARLHALNEKYPFVSMVAVEDRLKAIS